MSLGDQLRREAASSLRQRPLQAFRLQSLAGQVDVMQAELDQLRDQLFAAEQNRDLWRETAEIMHRAIEGAK